MQDPQTPLSSSTYTLYDLAGGWSVWSEEDLPHQEGLDGAPHDFGDGVGLQRLHESVAERSFGKQRAEREGQTSY